MSTVEKPMICLETRATYVAPRTKGMVGKIGWECDPEGALITFKERFAVAKSRAKRSGWEVQ